METELNSKTIDHNWSVETLDFRDDIYAAINRKRVEAASVLREMARDTGYNTEQYDIRIKHHPLKDTGTMPIVGVSSAIITLRA